MTEPVHHCPVPRRNSEYIMLAHGEGGRESRLLIQQYIEPKLRSLAEHENRSIDFTLGDAASVQILGQELAFTTDSYVVSPLFFPGGDIGTLAVYGTVNDLAVSGADPMAMTLALILEEGLPLETLDRVLGSVRKASEECGVTVCAGDTKVVPKGACDQIFVNTSGIGHYRTSFRSRPQSIQVGDQILVSGPIGCHGIAVLCEREGLGLQPPPKSDCASLHAVCSALRNELGGEVRAMRDATRGGVSAVLHEWSSEWRAQDKNKSVRLIESQIPVAQDVRGVCELLGLDPLYVANEGTLVAAVSPESAKQALAVLAAQGFAQATMIGEVIDPLSASVVIERMLGSLVPVDEPTGAPLPRIC